MNPSEIFEGENSSLRKTFDGAKHNEELERGNHFESRAHDVLDWPPDHVHCRCDACKDVVAERVNFRIQEFVVNEDTSDGYHTFKELYEFRLLYNAHLFNEWAKQGTYDVHKSQRHSDGELCFGRNDYFIVVATLPTGQISNHYPMSDWDLFKCEAVEKAKAQWDGHSSQDVATRLREALSQKYISKEDNK